PTVIGNAYLIIGTVEKRIWREGVAQPKGIAEMLPQASDFATYYNELRLTCPGYYRAEQDPPVLEPPVSQEWVKETPGPWRRWTERIRAGSRVLSTYSHECNRQGRISKCHRKFSSCGLGENRDLLPALESFLHLLTIAGSSHPM